MHHKRQRQVGKSVIKGRRTPVLHWLEDLFTQKASASEKKTSRASPCFSKSLIFYPPNHYSKYMSYTSWCHRADILCHRNQSSEKVKRNVRKQLLVMVRKDDQDAEKERITLRSSIKVVLLMSSCSWCRAIVNEKIKVMKQRRSRENRIGGKSKYIAFFESPTHPSPHLALIPSYLYLCFSEHACMYTNMSRSISLLFHVFLVLPVYAVVLFWSLVFFVRQD